MRRPALAALLCLTAACAGPARVSAPAGTRTGLDALIEDRWEPLKGKRVGLITNRTGVDRRGRPIVELMAAAPGVTLAAVFTPEHSFTAASESENIASGLIRAGGREIPLHSLYSGGIAGMRPAPEHLAGLDALVFDIQDIGARFYTYLATMAMGLEEAKRAGIQFMVLDRPNPLGGALVEGPVLEDPALRLVTPTAYFQIPVRHGLTAAEIALWHNKTVGHDQLKIMPMRGWARGQWFDETGLPWVPPSPNMPDLDAASLYPGVGIFESSNLSVGRGTPRPFRWIGAPWLKAEELAQRLTGQLDGVEFEAEDFVPSKSVYAGESCRGVRIRVTDRNALRPLAVFRKLALALRELHPREFHFRWDEAKRMVGVEEFRLLWESGAGEEAFAALFDKGPAEFAASRKSVLLY